MSEQTETLVLTSTSALGVADAMAIDGAASGLVTLIYVSTEDGEVIGVDKRVCDLSRTLANMLTDIEGEEVTEDNAIPLPNISAATLANLIKVSKLYLDHAEETGIEIKPAIGASDSSESTSKSADDEADDDDDDDDDDLLPNDDNKPDAYKWCKEFYGGLDKSDLFDLTLAVNFLDIKPLFDACCHTIAEMIKGKTPEEIRTEFDIENDFTPEEEEQIRKENEWCMDL